MDLKIFNISLLLNLKVVEKNREIIYMSYFIKNWPKLYCDDVKDLKLSYYCRDMTYLFKLLDPFCSIGCIREYFGAKNM